MKQKLFFSTAVLAASLACNITANATVNKSLVIALDGFRADGLRNGFTPHMDSLINGTFSSGYKSAYDPVAQNVFDAATVSGPNHVSIMTGVTSAKHGVTGNGDMAGGNYGTYKHYLTQLEESNSSLNTAYLYTWGTDSQIANNADYKFDGGDVSNTVRMTNIINGTHSDTNWAQGTDPDALFLFLDDPDGAGHGNGYNPRTLGYSSQLTKTDGQVGALLNAIRNRPTFANENWEIIITSDHGGDNSGHGARRPAQWAIPYIVSSKTAQQGQISGAHNYDAAPTALSHMGITPPNYMDGVNQGNNNVATSDVDLQSGLAVKLSFDGNLQDTSGNNNHAFIGVNSDHDPIVHNDLGKRGGYVEINNHGGGEDNSSYLSLGNPTGLSMGDNDSFTVAMWYRTDGDSPGDPVILGNKNWDSGSNKGYLLVDNNGGSTGLQLNAASAGEDRLDLQTTTGPSLKDWTFIATTFNVDGTATLFTGGEDGILSWVSRDAKNVGDLNSVMPLNIGQDGTGTYAYNIDADIDELAIYSRSLNINEIAALFNKGEGIGVPPITENNLVLTIDPNTGMAVLQNNSLREISLSSYDIESNAGSLDASTFEGLEDKSTPGWEEANPTANHLAELNVEGMLTLEPGQIINLGDILNDQAVQDIIMTFSDGGVGKDAIFDADVEYGTLPFLVDGDVNWDMIVDDIDLKLIKEGFGEKYTLAHLFAARNNYNPVDPSSVPEPASIFTILTMVTSALIRRQNSK